MSLGLQLVPGIEMRAHRLVHGFRAEQRITNTATTLFGSYAIALRYLHSLGEPLRAR